MRLCIVGWSYGGCAALIGVVKEPQLYRCAVSIADKAELQIESPLRHADRIATHSRAMAKALSQHPVRNQRVLIRDGETGSVSRCESSAALILVGREQGYN